MATDFLRGLSDRYRQHRDSLATAKATEFPVGDVVYVNSPRCHDFGIVANDGNCPVDQLAVELENGNVWWYPLEDCSQTVKGEWPDWLKRRLWHRKMEQSKTIVRKLG